MVRRIGNKKIYIYLYGSVFAFFFASLHLSNVFSKNKIEKKHILVENGSIEKNYMKMKKGSWSPCNHLQKYGLNFDYGLANFLTFHLQPMSAIEVGCGIGLYLKYLTDYQPWMTHAIGIEPQNMSRAGVFSHEKLLPYQVTGDVFSKLLSSKLQNIPPSDLVYSIEVAEHLTKSRLNLYIEFLVSKTKRYLVFSAARPNQEGTGHLRDSMFPKNFWIKIFESKGMFYLKTLSKLLSKSCDEKNKNHVRNIFIMGKNPELDIVKKAIAIEKSPNWDENDAFAKALFPDIERRLQELSYECLHEKFTISVENQ